MWWRFARRYAESEQSDMIHFLEGVSPSVIDESTGVPLKQEDMMVKIYVRPSSDEVKNRRFSGSICKQSSLADHL